MFFFQNRHHLPSFWKGFWRCQQLKQLPHISQHFGFQVLGVTHTAQNGATLRIVSRMHRWHRDVPSSWKELPRLNAGYDAYPLQKKTSLYIPPNGKQPENRRELKRASRRRGYVLSKRVLSYHLLRWNCRSSQRWQPMVVGSEEHQKSTGRLSNRKIMGKSWELPTSKRVTSDTFLFPVVLWLVESRRSLHPLPTSHLARCVNLIFMLQSSGPKSLCVFFCSMLTTSSPIVQYSVIYGYRICLLQYTHVSFPPKTTQSWWSCGLTKRKPLCLKRLYFVKTENVSAVRKGKRALYYDMDLHCCWLGKSLGSLC